MGGDTVRRRRRRRAGKFARAIARLLAARMDRPVDDVAHGISAAASEATGAATWAASHLGSVYRAIADDASTSARARALRAQSRIPLPSLQELHPEASRLPVRSLGVQEVSVADIVGTAVAGPDQRGSDFRPLPAFRGSDWRARWLRIRTAVARMEPLPPVDLQKYDDRFWVVDGHNRVAAALYEGQLVVDAVVQELVPPGAPSLSERPSMASEMAEGTAIRTAATGVHASHELRSDREGSMARPDVRTEDSCAQDGGTGTPPGDDDSAQDGGTAATPRGGIDGADQGTADMPRGGTDGADWNAS